MRWELKKNHAHVPTFGSVLVGLKPEAEADGFIIFEDGSDQTAADADAEHEIQKRLHRGLEATLSMPIG